jgi:site-specific DNA-cytosine methylase
MRYSHASLFSGIGGPEIAAQSLGIMNLFHCEINPFCAAVLRRHFPESREYTDVTKESFTEWMDKVTFLTGGFPCFAAGTQVLTSGGYMAIEDVMAGMRVLTADGAFNPVVETMSHMSGGPMMEVWLEGLHDSIVCTPNHPFLVMARGNVRIRPVYTAANDLTTDMSLFHPISNEKTMVEDETGRRFFPARQQLVKIKKIKRFINDNIKVYNLHVANSHTYTVYGVVVHNCQPFSVAGLRAGADDERYLWPHFKRVIGEVKPTCVIAENVAGIASMVEPGEVIPVEIRQLSLFDEDDGVRRYERRQPFTIERICKDFEDLGYEVQPVVIPASAVGAPHRRYRCFFIAFRRDGKICGLQGVGDDSTPAIRGLSPDVSVRTASDADSHGLPRQAFGRSIEEERLAEAEPCEESSDSDGVVRNLLGWGGFPNQPIIRRRNDGLPIHMVRYLTKEVFDAIHRMPVFGCMLVVVGNRERLEELCEQHGVEASTVTTIVTSRQADEPSEWADETSAKIMAYLGRNAVIGIPEFFAMCKRIEKIVVARRNTVREKSLMAYGNAIVPQVMRKIMQACLVTIRQKK